MSEEFTDLRVHELRVHNFKRIQDVHIVPLGPVTPIIGKNEAGKSSVLDSFWAVLGGGEACPDMPVRRGAKDAEARLDLGDLIAVRKWKAGKDKNGELKVTAKDGTPIRKQQDVLNSLISRSMIDPLSFERSKPAERLAILAKIARVDLNGFQRRREKLFAERADINRDLKRIEVELDAMPAANDEIPTTETSVAGIMTRIEEIEKANREIEVVHRSAVAAKEKYEQHQAHIAGWEEEPVNVAKARDTRIAELLAQIEKTKADYAEIIANAERQAVEKRAELDDLQAKANAAAEAAAAAKMVDVQPFRDKIRQADRVNALVRQQAARRAKAAEGNAKLAKKAELEKAMEAIDEEKVKAVAAAALPIPGITLGDDDVLVNRIPFEQCSSAQKLELSAIIGLETNKLKMMIIKDGSLLDGERMKKLEEIAVRYNAQIFIERVSDDASDGEVGIRIVEGYTEAELKAANEAKAEIEAGTNVA